MIVSGNKTVFIEDLAIKLQKSDKGKHGISVSWGQITMKIRKYRQTDLVESSALISETFRKFNSGQDSSEKVRRYVSYYRPINKNIDELKSNFSRTPIIFVTETGGEIVGIIRGRTDRITNLFVKEGYHGKNCGKRLLEKFEKECIVQDAKNIKVNASLYSVPFYQKMGYMKTTGNRNMRGLLVQPMKKYLQDNSPT